MANITAREMYDLKQKAIEYYNANGVPQRMEDVLNSMFYDKPEDVYGHLSAYFESFAKAPVITKVQAREAIDSRGQPSILTNVYGTVKNMNKLLCSSIVSNATETPDHARAEEKEAEQLELEMEVSSAMELINGEMNQQVQTFDTTKQERLDDILRDVIGRAQAVEAVKQAKEAAEHAVETEAAQETSPRILSASNKGKKSPKGKKGGGSSIAAIPDEPKEKLQCGCSAICALSKALCEAGAVAKNMPLYEYIAELKNGESPSNLRLPQPMVTILSGAKAAPGKVNCIKEYMVVPRHDMPLKESIPAILKMFQKLGKSAGKVASARGGKGAIQSTESLYRMVNDIGVLCPPFERPEQGLDQLQEAITNVGMEVGKDFFIALNCAAHETFDYDKGKYEVVTGNSKEPEAMVEFWLDLIQRYPSIIAIIDPMRKVEKEPWQRLCDRASNKVYLGGDVAWERPGLQKEKPLSDQFKTSAYVVRQEKMNSVTDIIQAAKKMQDANNVVILKTSQAESPDSFLADMAVGIGARFLMVGGPCRGERITKLNRLVEIELELQEKDRQDSWGAFSFPHLSLPEPPVLEDEPMKQDELTEPDADKKDEKQDIPKT